MRWRAKPVKDITEEHQWFAWYPVRFSYIDEVVWLERVERRWSPAQSRWVYTPNKEVGDE